VSLVARGAGAAKAGGGGRRPSERALSVLAVVLTFASGGLDVVVFARLGNVFASVMTGNMVVFGFALARASLSLGLHTGAAVCGYAAGVAAGTRLGSQPGRGGNAPGPAWPPRMLSVLLAELALLAGFVIGWEVAGFHPAGAGQIVMLIVAACAMGLQSAAVVQMDLGSVSTTYLTGTLTSLVTSLVQREGRSRGGAGFRRPGVLLGLLAGATLAGLLVAYADAIAPFPPLLAVALAAGLASGRQGYGIQDKPASSDRAGGAAKETPGYLRDLPMGAGDAE
jgi:uncharacterized membrane protein YoaK (UPF0700 family)